MGRGDLLLFGDTLQAVAMLYVLLFIGILLATKPWFQSGPNLLSRLLTQIILPFNVFQSVTRYLASLSEAGTLLPLFFWALLTLLVSIAVSWGLSYVMHLPRLRKGVFIGAASFPNIILLGFPIVEAIYGAEVMKYTVIYFIADTVDNRCNFFILHQLISSCAHPSGNQAPAAQKKFFTIAQR